MDVPPPYSDRKFTLSNSTSLPFEVFAGRLNVCHKLTASRSDKVADLVAQIMSILHSRAQSGLSRSLLIFIPSGQAIPDIEAGQHWYGHDEDFQKPLIMQLQSERDSLGFWSQPQASEELTSQLQQALFLVKEPERESDHGIAVELPEPKKGSFESRAKTLQSLEIAQKSKIRPASQNVLVELSEMYRRTENDFGLFETMKASAISIKVVL